MRLLGLAVACLFAAGCNASTWQALLPTVLGMRAPTAPPTIRGKVYGNAVGPTTKVAIKSVDEPGANEDQHGIVFEAVEVDGGSFKFEFPKTYNEQFVLFAFQDDNNDGLIGPDGATSSTGTERTSSGGRCGKITVESPFRNEYGVISGKWTLRTCNEEEGPGSTDFDNADIRFSY